MILGKILNNYVCNKLDLVIFLPPRRCIFTGLEEENESLSKKLASCIRDNKNLQEELSEAYRIKTQLADLHAAEVSKNIEASKQIKFFQNCVASAFAERDSSLIEAEKAKEQWETVSEKIEDYENQLRELKLRYSDEKELNSSLLIKIDKSNAQKNIFEEVISKFSEIRERTAGAADPISIEAKCSALLDDPPELWIFDAGGNHGRYIASLEEQIVTLRESIEGIQRKMRMGMDVEQYLRKKVRSLEKIHVRAENKFRRDLSMLREFFHHHRSAIVAILEEEKSVMLTTFDQVKENLSRVNVIDHPEEGKFDYSLEGTGDFPSSEKLSAEGKPVDQRRSDLLVSSKREEHPAEREPLSPELLNQAMKEKVEALLLLSQEEERHLLERDLNAALGKRIEDLQRSLAQVTNEKVQALIDLAHLKQECQLLKQTSSASGKDKNTPSITVQEKGETLKGMLKKTYLRRWVGRGDIAGEKIHLSPDSARLQAENAALRESMAGVDQLASSVRNLRLSLLKVLGEARSGVPAETLALSLEMLFQEVDRVRSSLRCNLPVSWSGGVDDTQVESLIKTSGNEDVDLSAAVGSEMVDLLVLAVELARDYVLATSFYQTSTAS
ncbi:myosin heavy chain-like protein isoform X2 [Wolffia australiana]